MPVDEGYELYDAFAGPKRLVILEGADHRLTGAHLQKAVDETSEGSEFGVQLEADIFIAVGDTLKVFTEEKITPTLS